MKPIAYLLTRLGIATSMLGHGLVRLPKLQQFSEKMVQQFSETILPEPLVYATGYLISIGELIVGVLLVIGLFTRLAAIGGALLMLLLIFGCTLIENWGALPSQMIHLGFFIVVIQFLVSNYYSVDNKLLQKQ